MQNEKIKKPQQSLTMQSLVVAFAGVLALALKDHGVDVPVDSLEITLATVVSLLGAAFGRWRAGGLKF